MDSLNLSELLQLVFGAAGAFLGGLLLTWRVYRSLPELTRNIVRIAVNAMRAVVAEEARAVLEKELEQPLQRVQALEANVQQLRKHAGLPYAELRSAER